MIRRERLPEDSDDPRELASHDSPAVKSPSLEGCWNCRFWRRSGQDGPGPDWGQCKRMPPVLPEVEDEKMVHVGIWPSTEAKDWCGEWQLRSGSETA